MIVSNDLQVEKIPSFGYVSCALVSNIFKLGSNLLDEINLFLVGHLIEIDIIVKVRDPLILVWGFHLYGI